MVETVFITRWSEGVNGHICIYGVYSSHDKALADLPIEKEGLKYERWNSMWINRATMRYYFIDEFTVK